MLPSGLSELVGDEEDLARILKSSSHFTAAGVIKAAAFMPAADGTTSVIRHGAEPREALWQIADAFIAGHANVHGAAICKARAIRDAKLDVVADEPPPRHANVVGWPVDTDPEAQKAKQKEKALAIAARSLLVKPRSS